MKKSNPEVQEASDRSLIEEVSKINYISLGEGAATCQVCVSSLREGESVVVCVFRPAGEVMFQVGHVICGDGKHELPKEFTLGVRELVVSGRVGWCSNGATQSSWLVLLDPEILLVSAAATKSVRKISDGGMAANVACDVEDREMVESSAKMSLGEAQRRANWSDGDVVCGRLWGDQR